MIRIPLGSITRWANSPDLRASIIESLPIEGPDLRSVAEEYDATFGSGRRPPVRGRLAVPKTRPYPDDFYRRIAERFSRGTTAAELAEDTDRPITTVHRWVAEARRRGLLPLARPLIGPTGTTYPPSVREQRPRKGS